MSGLLRYKGRDSSGTARTGVLRENATPYDFARARFDAHWQELSIHDERDELVGYVGPNPDNGQRTWWAVKV